MDQKIGILGGTFDPVHIAHLMFAERAASTLGLSKVIFIPTGRPPHKDVRMITPAEHRLEMVRLAIADNSLFELSDVECLNSGVSYTYSTLETLRGQYGVDAEFYYIIGSDVLEYVTKFKNYRRVFDACTFVTSQRPGTGHKQTGTLASELARAFGAKIVIIDFPETAISSSLIREWITGGQDVRYMVPDAAIEYIQKHGLYKDAGDTAVPGYWEAIPDQEGNRGGSVPAGKAFDAAFIKKIDAIVSARLGKKRYSHTLAVMETAKRLALRFGADPDKAAMAGLLHDCMRDVPKHEMVAYCEANGISITDFETRTPALLHAPAGAMEARKLLGVRDLEIEEAIACHTTGRAGMGLLAKIIFVADAVEPERDFDAAYAARRMLEQDNEDARLLDEVLLFLLDRQIVHIVETGSPLHPDTVFTRNWVAGDRL